MVVVATGMVFVDSVQLMAAFTCTTNNCLLACFGVLSVVMTRAIVLLIQSRYDRLFAVSFPFDINFPPPSHSKIYSSHSNLRAFIVADGIHFTFPSSACLSCSFYLSRDSFYTVFLCLIFFLYTRRTFCLTLCMCACTGMSVECCVESLR